MRSKFVFYKVTEITFRALTLLVEHQEEHLASKKIEWCGVSVVICLKQGAYHLHGPADATASQNPIISYLV